jgi:hypothetical protein
VPDPARPCFNSSISQLEAMFSQHRHDRARLIQLRDELLNRKTDRAGRLLSDVETELSRSHASEPLANAPAARQRIKGASDTSTPPAGTGDECNLQPPEPRVSPPRRDRALPLVTNAPPDILSAWIALEVLSPPTFERPDRLAGDGMSSVVKLSERLPRPSAGPRKQRPPFRGKIILASSRDPRQFIQRRGRILRRASGKSIATIQDFVWSCHAVPRTRLASPATSSRRRSPGLQSSPN